MLMALDGSIDYFQLNGAAYCMDCRSMKYLRRRLAEVTFTKK